MFEAAGHHGVVSAQDAQSVAVWVFEQQAQAEAMVALVLRSGDQLSGRFGLGRGEGWGVGGDKKQKTLVTFVFIIFAEVNNLFKTVFRCFTERPCKKIQVSTKTSCSRGPKSLQNIIWPAETDKNSCTKMKNPFQSIYSRPKCKC